MYTRYKDDIEVAIESLEKGSKLDDDKIIVDVEKKSVDENKSDTKITMEVVQKIANSINPMIKLTVETLCDSPDGKLAVLDLKVSVNHKEQNRIDCEFFENQPRTLGGFWQTHH